MLRFHFLQQWYELNAHMEVKSHLMAIHRVFASLDHGLIIIPGETTILRFRYLLEKNGLARQFLKIIDALVRARGLHIQHGTAVDATIIAAPSSTTNWGRK